MRIIIVKVLVSWIEPSRSNKISIWAIIWLYQLFGHIMEIKTSAIDSSWIGLLSKTIQIHNSRSVWSGNEINYYFQSLISWILSREILLHSDSSLIFSFSDPVLSFSRTKLRKLILSSDNWIIEENLEKKSKVRPVWKGFEWFFDNQNV